MKHPIEAERRLLAFKPDGSEQAKPAAETPKDASEKLFDDAKKEVAAIAALALNVSRKYPTKGRVAFAEHWQNQLDIVNGMKTPEEKKQIGPDEMKQLAEVKKELTDVYQDDGQLKFLVAFRELRMRALIAHEAKARGEDLTGVSNSLKECNKHLRALGGNAELTKDIAERFIQPYLRQDNAGRAIQIVYEEGELKAPALAELMKPKPAEPPVKPVEPSPPVKPAAPTKPVETPPKPTGPAKPTEPVKPAEPAKPTEPVKPAEPAKPTEPVKPAEPPKPAVPALPEKKPMPSAKEQQKQTLLAKLPGYKQRVDAIEKKYKDVLQLTQKSPPDLSGIDAISTNTILAESKEMDDMVEEIQRHIDAHILTVEEAHKEAGFNSDVVAMVQGLMQAVVNIKNQRTKNEKPTLPAGPMKPESDDVALDQVRKRYEEFMKEATDAYQSADSAFSQYKGEQNKSEKAKKMAEIKVLLDLVNQLSEQCQLMEKKVEGLTKGTENVAALNKKAADLQLKIDTDEAAICQISVPDWDRLANRANTMHAAIKEERKAEQTAARKACIDKWDAMLTQMPQIKDNKIVAGDENKGRLLRLIQLLRELETALPKLKDTAATPKSGDPLGKVETAASEEQQKIAQTTQRLSQIKDILSRFSSLPSLPEEVQKDLALTFKMLHDTMAGLNASDARVQALSRDIATLKGQVDAKSGKAAEQQEIQPGEYQPATDDEFYRLIRSRKTVIVKFEKPACPPCIAMDQQNVFGNIKNDTVVVKANLSAIAGPVNTYVTYFQQVADYEAQQRGTKPVMVGFPLIVCFRDGKPVSEGRLGFQNEAALRDMLARAGQ